MIEAWASLKRFQRKGTTPPPDDPGNPTVNFHGEKRSNATHASTMVAEVATGRRVTLGADKSDDTAQFVEALRMLGVTPHVAQHTTHRRRAIDDRTTRHLGYAVSQRKRKRGEEIFGWLKTVGLMRKTRHRGTARVGWMFVFSLAVYNLVRIRNRATQAA